MSRTLAELIALDKASPGKLSIAVDGPRNLAGVTARAFNKRADTHFVLVPYPNINQGVQDTVAGRIEVGVFSISVVESLIRDGALRAIAIAANKKSAALPDAPLISETLAGFDLSGWFMLMAPAGTPKPIVDRMSAAIATAIRDPKIAEMGRKLGFEPRRSRGYQPAARCGLSPGAAGAVETADGRARYRSPVAFYQRPARARAAFHLGNACLRLPDDNRC